MKMYVYGLYDSMDKEQIIQYVGVTQNFSSRRDGQFNKRSPLGAWVAFLRAGGSDRSFKLLEECDEKDAFECEAKWIRELRPRLNVLIPADAKQIEKVRNADLKEISFGAFTGTLEQLEAAYIEHILNDCGGNKLAATRVLGIGRQTLYNRLASR